MISTNQVFTLFVCTVLLAAVSKAQNNPPATPVREVTDTYFGTKVVDPYRWLENAKDPEAVAWMRAQNDYTRGVLEKIPGRDKLLARIKELNNAGTIVRGARRVGEQYFYYKTAPGDDSRKLYVRDSLAGKERLLVDPERMSTVGKHHSVDYFEPSHDGRYVAYGLSASGSENSVLHIVETATGRELGESIDRAQFTWLTWRPDGRSFFYNRLAKREPGSKPTERYQKSKVYLHTLGADPDKESPVFGYGVSQDIKVAEDDFSFVTCSPVSTHAIGYVKHGVEKEFSLYVAPLASVSGTATPWRKIVDYDDQVTGFAVRGDDLYLLTHREAPRYKVIRIKLSAPDLTRADVIVEPSEAVITGLSVAEDGLYVQQLDGGIGRLLRVPFSSDTKPQRITLPFEGTISEVVTDSREKGAVIRLTSWTKPQLYYFYNPQTGHIVDTKLMPPSPIDYSRVESVEVKAANADGTRVPLSIIYKQGLVRDGSNPTLLRGYGAYGTALNPAFDPLLLAWLEHGGVYAVAHVRGGGEYGEDWHKAGQKLKKQNTISDFIACVEYLIKGKYTSPAHLAGEGASAGGILIGGAITQRPDLFGAGFIEVGNSNPLRSEVMESGPVNIPEFGTVKTPDGFKALYQVDAYHRVSKRTPYPAVMLTTGITDARVAPWQSAKMAARLQAASTSGKPVLLRVDYDAGHGFGSTKTQREMLTADKFAFLMWQLGIQEFQPARAT